ncbi:MAG TPA: aminotransferase class V-fold PLP-dependent enzyme [Pyrinomonadaceae bacterium]|nr:aminotransferase class V-fold PLP-dependent enzyme [Pyrinomonadaceae bacterium]
MIYLDNNATTVLVPEVFAAMRPFLEGSYGNPSSAYCFSLGVKATVETAREAVAALLGAAPNEIVFTSGGTESDNWAILGALEASPGKRHIVTTRVEHEAVRKLCQKLETKGYAVTWLDVDEIGALDLDQVRESLRDDTALVSVMMANNETGVLFPVAEIAEIVKEKSDAVVHVDGVNAAGKIPIDLKNTKVDLFSISAHKFHGPKGVGVLCIRDGLNLPAIQIGGGQENKRRAGTEAVHQIAGIGAAAKYVSDLSPMERTQQLRDKLENAILKTIPNSSVNGTRDPRLRLPNTTNISFENTNGEMIMSRLDDEGICVSTGSACHAADNSASPVLEAMNIPYSRSMGSIRFSLGRQNTEAEIDRVVEVLPSIVSGLRRLAGSANRG